jgi:hypothetical protein
LAFAGEDCTMSRGSAVCTGVGVGLLILAAVYAVWGGSFWAEAEKPARTVAAAAPAPAALPAEEPPPPGLPIVAWGRRDHFQILRTPAYVHAEQADRLLATDEPVLGLVVGGEARAYSTNQLNEHEMVIDTVGGVPILVSY